MSNLFGNRTLKTVVREALDALGGRAAHDDLVEAVRNVLTMREYQEWAESAFRGAVIKGAKSSSTKDGLDSVYGTGDGVSALRLFSVEEFEDKAREAARLSRSNRDLVYVLSELCMEAHGRTFDAAAVLRSAA